MRLSLNILSTFLHSFGGRKVLSSSRNTHLPNIFARRNPHVAARSAKLRAAKSAGRIRNKTAHNTTGPVRGANPRGGARAAKRRLQREAPPLQRCNNALVPPAPIHPQLPGAYVHQPSFIVPGFPELDHRHLPPLILHKVFFDSLSEERQMLLRVKRERHAEARERRRQEAKARRIADNAEYARQLEQDMKKAQAAHRKAEEAEYARLLEEDMKKARAAQRKAEEEEFKRLLEEDRRKAQEAQRLAEAREAERRERERLEEERRRRAEYEESMEQARRERERQERERLFQRAIAEQRLAEQIRAYEEKWVALRSNVVGMESLGFCDIPWPVLGDVRGVEDVTEERVLEFVFHPLHEYVRSLDGGPARSLRSEMLRWHPDKFEGKVLDRVVGRDREAVRAAAGNIARILTQVSAKVR